MLLDEDILPPQGQNILQAPAKGFSLAGDRGAPKGNINFAASSSATLQIPDTAQAWDCFSGTKDFKNSG